MTNLTDALHHFASILDLITECLVALRVTEPEGRSLADGTHLS